MKHQLFLFLLFCGFFLQADPLLVAVLMVKNEEPVMQTTLQPLVDAGITDFFIYDTGSTDNTIQVTKDFFKNNNITNFFIEQGEWIDFAASRNQALDLTEQHFPDATFMLMLDAEWILHNGQDLLQYCQYHKDNPATLHSIQIKGFNVELSHARLIRCKSNVRFEGKVHEVPNAISQGRIPLHVYFELSPTRFGKEKSKARWLKDIDILLEEYEKNPDNPRTVYYLAQTYLCLEDWKNAAKWYELRTTMSGWDEENYVAQFALAQAYCFLDEEEKMIANYLKAFCLRPHRAEPLIRLAEYYCYKKQFHLCYLFARHAATIPYPKNDILMIEKLLYDFVRYNLLSATAYIVQDYELGKQATLKALEIHPEYEYLQNNLKNYQYLLT